MYATLGMFKGSSGGAPPSDVYPTLAGKTFSAIGSGSTSRSLTLPPVITVGQLIVLIITAHIGTVNTPSGYTKVTSEDIFYKIATGTEDGSTVNFTVGSSSAVTMQSAWVFSDATVVEAASLRSSGADANPPSLTVSWGADKNLFMTITHPTGAGVNLNAYPTNCPLYRSNVSVSDAEECIAGAESLLATFNPNSWDTTTGEYAVYTLGLHAT